MSANFDSVIFKETSFKDGMSARNSNPSRLPFGTVAAVVGVAVCFRTFEVQLHPTSTIAATKAIGMVLRILERGWLGHRPSSGAATAEGGQMHADSDAQEGTFETVYAVTIG